jgi:Enoyl-(Acyl carrier protein) reductase
MSELRALRRNKGAGQRNPSGPAGYGLHNRPDINLQPNLSFITPNGLCTSGGVHINIYVTAIAPGAFKSDMNRDARDHEAEVAKRIPARRVGTAEDMAGAAIFLASRAGDYVIGSTLTVDGGVAFATPAMRDLQLEA